MSWATLWAPIFGRLVEGYFALLLLAALPTIYRALRSYARGEEHGTLRDLRLAAAEVICDTTDHRLGVRESVVVAPKRREARRTSTLILLPRKGEERQGAEQTSISPRFR